MTDEQKWGCRMHTIPGVGEIRVPDTSHLWLAGVYE